MSPWLLVGALVAGWIDAVIGGGGLVMLPLLMASGLAPTTALATNKLMSSLGTGSATITLIRKVGVPLPARQVLLYVAVSLVCSGVGALMATALSAAVMRPLVITLLVIVGVFVTLRPSFGQDGVVARTRPVVALGLSAAIAVYDGFFGPGTGMFLIMVFTLVLTGEFLRSAVLTKIVNLSTNVGALVVFLIGGHVLVQMGLMLAVANIIGAQLGARTVIGGGAKFIRYALLVMVVVMCVRLAFFS